jgi:hypothetical protein
VVALHPSNDPYILCSVHSSVREYRHPPGKVKQNLVKVAETG